MKKITSYLFALIFSTTGCASTERISPDYKSDHYDGKLFFNPGNTGGKSFFDLIKWKFTSDKKEWPEFRKLEAVANVSEVNDPKVVKLTFMNHASFLVQTKDFNVLTDPVWSERVSPFTFVGPKRVTPPGIEIEKLPKIHAVVISHNHYDHLDIETLKKLNALYRPKFFVPLGDFKLLADAGITDITEMDWNQKIVLDDKHAITFLQCQHWSARWLNDRFESLWGAYLIESYDRKIYFSGDTGYADHFKSAKFKFPKIDVALIPIGAYEPRWFMKKFHMNPEDSVQAALDLGSTYNFGMHFGTFQLTDEGIDEPKEFLAKVLKEKAPSLFFKTLKVGETYSILE